MPDLPPSEELDALETLELLTAGATGTQGGEVAAGELPADGIDLRAHLFAIEHSLITQALQRSGGTVAQAARLLGLRRTTLVEKGSSGIAGGEALSEVRRRRPPVAALRDAVLDWRQKLGRHGSCSSHEMSRQSGLEIER